MLYWLHRAGAPLSRWVPTWISYGLASLFGRVVFLLWREKRDNAISNMAQVLGTTHTSRRAHDAAKRSFANYGKYLIDMLQMASITPTELERRISIEGWGHFTDAFAEGQGVVFVGGHFGNSDIGGAFLAGRGYRIHVITETLSPPKWDALVQKARADAGLQVIPMESAALRSLRVLRQKGIIAFLIDRPIDDRGVVVRFFGAPARVPGGAAALALRSGARVLGAHITRNEDRFVLRISPVIPHPTTGDPARDLEALSQSMFDWFERVIREQPDQWFMFRSMWPSSGTAGYSHG